jgi:hypothetical protein
MVQEETYNHAAIIKPAKKYLKAKNDPSTQDQGIHSIILRINLSVFIAMR